MQFTKTRPPTSPKQSLWATLVKYKEFYLLALPAIVWYIVFCYLPMGGLSLAFKDYKVKFGIWGSPWVGQDNFELLFNDPAFFNSVKMTLWINLVELLLCFPAPILLAVLFNELRMNRYKHCLQTVFIFPHFLSWVIVGSLLKNFLSMDGVINGMMSSLGIARYSFLGDKDLFRPIIYLSSIWKEVGWDSIIYLSAITGIDAQQYEAAEIDGANRLQRIAYITIPGILPTVSIMLILRMGSMMGGHFDQIFNLQNDIISSAAETLNAYIYRITFRRTPSYGFSTAVSLFSSVINMILLVSANKLSEHFGGTGLMGGAER